MIRPIYKIATAAASEPITKTEAKLFLRLAVNSAGAEAYTDEDDLLDALIATVRAWVEQITGRSLITQTWDMWLQEWPSGDFIEIGKPPLQSVTHVKYTDAEGTETTLSTDDYSVDADRLPGRIVLDYGCSWPSFTPKSNNPIVIRFVAGYGDDSADIPAPIIHAMKLMIGHFYENREQVAFSDSRNSFAELPMGVASLLVNYRESGF